MDSWAAVGFILLGMGIGAGVTFIWLAWVFRNAFRWRGW